MPRNPIRTLLPLLALTVVLHGCPADEPDEPDPPCAEGEPTDYWPDCDGDGAPAGTPVSSCSEPDAAQSLCADGEFPDGGYVTSAPAAEDCDDEDPVQQPGQTWYPDCDGDGEPADTGFTQCLTPATECADQEDPDGGWSRTAGADCDDADARERPDQTWFADCDGDAYSAATPIEQCLEPDSPCTDEEAPDGGWSNEDPLEEADCDDQDAATNPGATDTWYDGVDSDCGDEDDFDQDGDGVRSFYDSDGLDCDDQDAQSTFCGHTAGAALASCGALFAVGLTADGPYWIDPDADGDTSDAWQTYCDMTRGGWALVLLNNQSVTSQTSPDWAAATSGSIVRGGTISTDLSGFDFLAGVGEWGAVGTTALLEMGSGPGSPDHQATYTLSVDAEDEFRLSISDEAILVGATSPELSFLDGVPLSAPDRDNDDSGSNCAADRGHPWWYLDCGVGLFWGESASDGSYWDDASTSHAWGALWVQ